MRQQHINADDFRYLTGLGRDAADSAELIVARAATKFDVRTFDASERSLSVEMHVFAPGYVPSPSMIAHLRERGIEKIGGREVNSLTSGRPVIFTIYDNDYEAESNLEITRWTGPNCETTVCPLPYITCASDHARLKGTHSVYLHRLVPAAGDLTAALNAGLNYVGMTRQGWQVRLSQHMTAAKAGSPLLFHRALRDWAGKVKVTEHRILGAGMPENEALDLEELAVRGAEDEAVAIRVGGSSKSWAHGTLYPRGLNMIPGGKAGLAYLHKLGALAPRQAIDLERREEFVSRLIQTSQREGRPNPLLAALWCDDDYAARIICGPEGRLKPNQIETARLLASYGTPSAEIAERIGAKNPAQIDRLLKGATYTRIGKRPRSVS
jgi:hypothetical protein